jgi:hypothetical protein
MQHLDVTKVSAHKAEALVYKSMFSFRQNEKTLYASVNYKLIKLKVDLELDILGFK